MALVANYYTLTKLVTEFFSLTKYSSSTKACWAAGMWSSLITSGAGQNLSASPASNLQLETGL
jgi:hypothetical protein